MVPISDSNSTEGRNTTINLQALIQLNPTETLSDYRTRLNSREGNLTSCSLASFLYHANIELGLELGLTLLIAGWQSEGSQSALEWRGHFSSCQTSSHRLPAVDHHVRVSAGLPRDGGLTLLGLQQTFTPRRSRRPLRRRKVVASVRCRTVCMQAKPILVWETSGG